MSRSLNVQFSATAICNSAERVNVYVMLAALFNQSNTHESLLYAVLSSIFLYNILYLCMIQMVIIIERQINKTFSLSVKW